MDQDQENPPPAPCSFTPASTLQAAPALRKLAASCRSLAIVAVLCGGTLQADIIKPDSVTTTIPSDAGGSHLYLLADNAGHGEAGLMDLNLNQTTLDNGDPIGKALGSVAALSGTGQAESWTAPATSGNPVFVFDLGEDKAVGSVILWQYGNNGGFYLSNANHTHEFEVIFHTEAEGDSFDFDTEAVEFAGAMEAASGPGPGAAGAADNPAQLFPMVEQVNARYVALRIASNFLDQPGFAGGGERFGLGEVRFATEVGVDLASEIGGEFLLTPGPGAAMIGGRVIGSQFEVGVEGTSAGGNNWPAAEPPSDLINGQFGGPGEKYVNFAELNTGVLVTPAAAGGQTLVDGMALWVADDAVERDPASYALYGTNSPVIGGGPFPLADFTLISAGPLSLPDTRDTVEDASGLGQFVPIANTTPYASYLVVFPTVKNPAAANSMQLSELQLTGSFVEPFRITDFSRDGGTADLTFTSTPGAEYGIESSTDGRLWTPVSAGAIIAGTGATTSVSDLALPAPAPEALLLRVRRGSFMEMVTVGNPRNTDDTEGDPNPAGAVPYEYRIGKYEVTNAQYAAFLNAVAAEDPNALYSDLMGSSSQGGITRSGSSPNFTYSVKADMGDKPVNYVSWYDALRFCNWLHHGRPSGAQGPGTTEDGAYTFTGPQAVTFPGSDQSYGTDGRNAGARYWLPSEDEWYKAAYHEPGASTNDYWLYPTRSDDAPTAVTANASGDGNAGPAGNFANFDGGANWNGENGNVTTVGTNGGPSFYGAHDLGGNLWEWNEIEVFGDRGLRGGSWLDFGSFLRSSSRNLNFPALEDHSVGFRVAGP